ncbi:MAG: DUF362 domain-containing protein [Polyangiaceae bacterium]|nr:DUF362 domain-containing protein [Polyangiaceae bacterium]
MPSATDVMSAASPSWDAGPKVHPTGEVDGASLRRTTRARLASDRSPVTFLQGGTPRELGERLCTDVVPQRPKETPILIKPNLGGFEWFKDPAKNHGDDGLRGRITDPEFVRGIVRCLKARGHDAITIAEGWGATHADWEKLVRLSGYAAMARDENVRLVAMDDDGVFDVEGDTPGKPLRVTGMEQTHTPTLLMPKVLAEHLQRGLFISAPKIKAHRFGVFSAAIKGGQGVVMLSDASPAFHQKWRMHGELGAALKLLAKDKDAGNKAYLRALDLFAERMSDVLEVAAPHVVLAEGAPLEGGDGFAKRWPSAENIAIGGTNPIMVDRVVAAALGLWDNAELGKNLGGHKTSPLLEVAAKRFGIDVSTPAIQGDGASLLMTPRPVHFVSMSGFALHSDASPPEIAPGAPADHAEHAASEMHAARVDDASIVIDGVAEAAWNKAPAITFDTDWSGARTPASTRVRALWSTRALYMLFEIENTGFHVDASRPVQTERDKLYEEDCVEIFVGTDPGNKNRYYEIEVGPLGHFFDLAIDRTKHLSDAAWSSDPVIATKVDREHRRATIEIALRSRDITAAFTPGARLPFALYRMEGKAPRLYLAWRPTRTPKPNFHVPEAFGTLVLDAPATR